MTPPVIVCSKSSLVIPPVVAEAEHYTEITDSSTHAWDTATTLGGYEGESYLHALPDIDLLLQPDALDDSPTAVYPIHFSTHSTSLRAGPWRLPRLEPGLRR